MVGRVTCGLMLAVGLGLAGCVPPPPSQTIVTLQAAPEQDRAVREELAPMIGMTLWTKGNNQFRLCQSSGPCAPKSGKFTLDSVESVSQLGIARMHLSFADGASGIVEMRPDAFKLSAVDRDPLIASLPTSSYRPKADPNYKSPFVYPGMTTEQVLSSVWGKPKRIRDKYGVKGHREWWYYPKGGILHFVDGRLVDIEEMKH